MPKVWLRRRRLLRRRQPSRLPHRLQPLRRLPPPRLRLIANRLMSNRPLLSQLPRSSSLTTPLSLRSRSRSRSSRATIPRQRRRLRLASRRQTAKPTKKPSWQPERTALPFRGAVLRIWTRLDRPESNFRPMRVFDPGDGPCDTTPAHWSEIVYGERENRQHAVEPTCADTNRARQHAVPER